MGAWETWAMFWPWAIVLGLVLIVVYVLVIFVRAFVQGFRGEDRGVPVEWPGIEQLRALGATNDVIEERLAQAAMMEAAQVSDIQVVMICKIASAGVATKSDLEQLAEVTNAHGE